MRSLYTDWMRQRPPRKPGPGVGIVVGIVVIIAVVIAGFFLLLETDLGDQLESPIESTLEEIGDESGDEYIFDVLEVDSTYVVENHLQWGSYTVTWGSTKCDSIVSLTRIEITLDGEIVDASVDYLCEAETRDLDGDGYDELIVWEYSGGAHCCSYYYIYSYHPQFREMGDIYTGHGNLHFEDLDGDGVLEGVGSYDGLAYYDWSFAASPFPPIIFSLKEDWYVENTKEFPDLLRESLKSYLYEKPADSNDPYYKYHRFPRAGAVLAYCILLDEEQRAFELMKEFDPEMISWMEKNREPIREIMSGMPERTGFRD